MTDPTHTRREQLDLALLRRYHEHRDTEAREQLVRRAMPLVRSLARPYAGRGEPLEDLVQVGCVGLLKAIERFDDDAGVRFITYAAPTITGEIKRHFRDHGWIVHVPRGVQEMDAKVNRASEAMASATGTAPTAKEVASKLEVDVAQVEEAMQGGQGYRALSLDHPAGEGREALDLFGKADAGYDDAEKRDLIRDGCEILDERERQVVFMRYFDDQLQREIAERIGVSQMQVSRVLRGALVRMRAHLRDERENGPPAPPTPPGPPSSSRVAPARV